MAETFGIGNPPGPAAIERLYPGAPVAGIGARSGNSGGAPEPPPTQLDLGTIVTAIVRASAATGTAPALAVGTQLRLRIVAPPPNPTPGILMGEVADGPGGESLIATPLGILALLRRLSLPVGMQIAFEQLGEIAPKSEDGARPLRVGAWPALEDAIDLLRTAQPALADALRAELMPSSGSELAATLLFLAGAIYRGTWPGAAVLNALAAAGHASLAKQLGGDIADLKRLGANTATGDWQVLTLPLFAGTIVLPVQLFLPRRKGTQADGTRFALEIELAAFGPLQLDGLLRGKQLVLVLRSHRTLPPELRQVLSGVFHASALRWGLTGDLSFTAAARFVVAPLDPLKGHVAVSV